MKKKTIKKLGLFILPFFFSLCSKTEVFSFIPLAIKTKPKGDPFEEFLTFLINPMAAVCLVAFISRCVFSFMNSLRNTFIFVFLIFMSLPVAGEKKSTDRHVRRTSAIEPPGSPEHLPSNKKES